MEADLAQSPPYLQIMKISWPTKCVISESVNAFGGHAVAIGG